jgi:hypothetical protein
MNVRLIVPIVFIALAAASRLFPHPPDFTPLAAMALFGGAYFSDRRVAFAVPFIALLLSDLVLGLHQTMPFVYLGFGATVFIGMALRGKVRVLPVAGAAIASSVLFFIVTNFGVWLVGDMYPHDVGGLVLCYIAAIPFFQYSLMGDFLYTGLLFGGMAMAERYLWSTPSVIPD